MTNGIPSGNVLSRDCYAVIREASNNSMHELLRLIVANGTILEHRAILSTTNMELGSLAKSSLEKSLQSI